MENNQEEMWEDVDYRMNEKEMECYFINYSDFNELNDEKFHELMIYAFQKKIIEKNKIEKYGK